MTECVSFLEEVSLHCRCYRVPSVAVSLPVMGRRTLGQEDTVQLCLPSTGRDLPISEILCQVYYVNQFFCPHLGEDSEGVCIGVFYAFGTISDFFSQP